ncbi:sugar ABC transporter permease [Brachyspira hampsonii]|uniref:Sugar ABC transporter permease n=2 Tax=Brachyspira hampsonii TaxID=1287055 RepID=A0AAC9XJP2_9SPIR|nr:sugar ABC transporter permease [Brachyspira hampsonii]ASJ20428.1 sugar ABC transporter permease [Brachyspira hampsonii]OEJ18605.1 sugar ABC transporter permease [Brachyspira hampsonii]
MTIKKNITPWIFLAPALFFIAVFSIYPLFETIVLSFMKQNRGVLTFAGIENYKRLFSDQYFFISLKNSLIYLIIQVPIMTILSILLAIILHRGITKLKSMYRTAFFIPFIVESVAYSLIFVLLFQERGVVNFLFSLFNIGPIMWLTQTWPARIVIMLIITWRWTGYNMVIILAGLQTIPEDYYEASRIDGANAFQQFFYITIPMLKPVILFSTILSTIGTLNLFTEAYLLTNGGPNNSKITLGLYIYRQAFQSLNLTYAATISVAILVIVGVLSRLQMKFGGNSK